MSLQEKLSNLSQNLEETRAEVEKEIQNRDLEPVRLRIQELENQKAQLELVKNSVSLVANSEVGKGMREYANETNVNYQNESTRIDNLIDQHKEALGTVDIHDREQLVTNDEFVNEPEVQEYKKSKEQLQELSVADVKLLEKLKSLGIEINTDSFSYDQVEQALNERIQGLETELSIEKLKTPEGKEQAIEIIAGMMKDNLPQVFFHTEGDGRNRISIADGEVKIQLDERGVHYNGYDQKLLPSNIKDIEATYGIEIATLALKKAYAEKIDQTFDKFDKENEKNYEKRESLKSISPEEASRVRDGMQEYAVLQEVFRSTINAKSLELAESGIEFDPEYEHNLGCTYEKCIELAPEETIEYIENDLREHNTRFPNYNFTRLNDEIAERKEKLQQFIDAIANLKTKDDINNLLKTSDALIYKFRSRYDDLKIAENGFSKPRNIPAQTYFSAMDHFDNRIALSEANKGKIIQKLEQALDVREARIKLEQELQKTDFAKNIYEMDSEIIKIERNKKEALTTLGSILQLEMELPQEEPLEFAEGRITIPSVRSQIETQRMSINNVNITLDNIKNEISEHLKNEPKFFGKDKWEKKLQELKQTYKDLEGKINQLNSNTRELGNKVRFSISTERYSSIEEIVKSLDPMNGTSNEIFAVLTEKLNEVVNTKVPDSVTKLQGEYNSIQTLL